MKDRRERMGVETTAAHAVRPAGGPEPAGKSHWSRLTNKNGLLAARHYGRMASSLGNTETGYSKERLIMLFLPREEGQGLSEYALLLALVALVVMLILYVLGPAIGNLYSNIIEELPF